MSDFVWMEYPATGGKAQFPAPAVEAWKGIGWRECDPPTDSEPVPAPEAEAAEPSESKTASRKRGGETTTASEE